MKKTILILTIIALFVYSCKKDSTAEAKILQLMNQTQATAHDYTNGKKNMRFIGMTHISTKDFYNDVVKKVTEAKKNGYILFYEYIDFDKANDLEKRKVRKLVGFIPTPKGYEKQLKTLEGNHVAQNNDQFKHLVNDLDFNVDLTPQGLIKAYETKYGEIVLSDLDKNTPLSETITKTLPADRVMKIIIDVRNKNLSKAINTDKRNKIIVLYGTQHEKGLLKDLQELDPNWKAVD